jgi:hypothetical protein
MPRHHPAGGVMSRDLDCSVHLADGPPAEGRIGPCARFFVRADVAHMIRSVARCTMQPRASPLLLGASRGVWGAGGEAPQDVRRPRGARAMIETDCANIEIHRANSENDRLIFTLLPFQAQKRRLICACQAGQVNDRAPKLIARALNVHVPRSSVRLSGSGGRLPCCFLTFPVQREAFPLHRETVRRMFVGSKYDISPFPAQKRG